MPNGNTCSGSTRAAAAASSNGAPANVSPPAAAARNNGTLGTQSSQNDFDQALDEAIANGDDNIDGANASNHNRHASGGGVQNNNDGNVPRPGEAIFVFDREMFEPSVPAEGLFDDNTSARPISFYMDERNKNRTENTGLALQVIAINHGKATKFEGYGQRDLGNNKRIRVHHAGLTYDRFVVFADLMHAPYVCVGITNGFKQSNDMFHHIPDSWLGRVVFVLEPEIVEQKLGGTIPVIKFTDVQLYPFRKDVTLINTWSQMRIPEVVKEEFFFSIKGRHVDFQLARYTTDCCRGIQCDRQKPEIECACINFPSHQGTNMVLVANVIFPVNSRFFPKGQATSTFRSLHTTCLFFEDFDDFCSNFHDKTTIQAKQIVIRRRIKDMVTFINSNGGWNLVGWYKSGAVGDVSNESQSERVVNTKLTIHLSWLTPTIPERLLLPGYQRLKIRTVERDF